MASVMTACELADADARARTKATRQNIIFAANGGIDRLECPMFCTQDSKQRTCQSRIASKINDF